MLYLLIAQLNNLSTIKLKKVRGNIYMGCGLASGRNPFQFDNETQIINAIKQASPQQILTYIYELHEINSMSRYRQFINNFSSRIKAIELKYREQLNINQNRVRNRDDVINYHMGHVQKYIQFVNQAIKQMQKENQSLTMKIDKGRQDYWCKIEDLIKFKKQNKKIFTNMNIQNLQKRPQSFNSVRINQIKALQNSMIRQKLKQSQHSQKECQASNSESVINNSTGFIQQMLYQQDLDADERNKAIIERVQQLIKIIKRHQIQVSNLSTQNQNIKSRQLKLEADIQKFKEQIVRKKYQIDQLTEKYEKLQRKLSQQKIDKIILEQSKGNIVISQTAQTYALQGNKVQKCKQPEYSTKELEIQLQRPSSYSSQSVTNSVIFRKFSDSRIIFPGYQYHMGRKYQQIIDNIFSPIKIHSSQQLFQYDMVKNNNPFDYITQKNENLLLLVLLKNKTIIGAFSRLGFVKSMQQLTNNVCFIFSIHKGSQEYKQAGNKSKNKHKNNQFDQRIYKLDLKQRRQAKYSARLQKNFLKIGQNQIVIRNGKPEISLNINSNISIFRNIQDQISTQLFANIQKPVSSQPKSKQIKLPFQNFQIYQLQTQHCLAPCATFSSEQSSVY